MATTDSSTEDRPDNSLDSGAPRVDENKPVAATSPPRPELIFALVGAVGTRLGEVVETLTSTLDAYAYTTHHIQLSVLLSQIVGLPTLKQEPESDRLKTHMEAGSALRERSKRGDALAALAVARTRAIRKQLTGNSQTPASDSAFVFRSLKHPEEVEALRDVYREKLVVIGVHAARQSRVKYLCEKLAASGAQGRSEEHRADAEELIAIDEREPHRALGQRVGDAFPVCDFFEDVSDPGAVRRQIERLIELVFGHPFRTPTLMESGMFHARVAALRSGAMGRQVGAAQAGSGGPRSFSRAAHRRHSVWTTRGTFRGSAPWWTASGKLSSLLA